MSYKIRYLEMNDFPQWLALWDANNDGTRNEEITTELWSRLTDPDFPIFALVAENNKGELAGMVQYVVHHVTGLVKPICYMQDLYVMDEHRKKGLGRRLVNKLFAENKDGRWGRIYWFAAEDNIPAQKLYERLGKKLGFSFHVKVPG